MGPGILLRIITAGVKEGTGLEELSTHLQSQQEQGHPAGQEQELGLNECSMHLGWTELCLNTVEVIRDPSRDGAVLSMAQEPGKKGRSTVVPTGIVFISSRLRWNFIIMFILLQWRYIGDIIKVESDIQI